MSFPYFLSILQASGTFCFRTTPSILVLLAPTYSPSELLQQPVHLHICLRVCLLQQLAGLFIFIMSLTDHFAFFTTNLGSRLGLLLVIMAASGNEADSLPYSHSAGEKEKTSPLIVGVLDSACAGS